MKLLIFLVGTLFVACQASDDCVNSLCHEQKHGAMYRISDDKPGYFVQCSHGTAYCFQCPANLIFNDVLKVCDFPKPGGGGSGNSKKSLSYYIKTTWDSRPINHDPAKITLSWEPYNDHITAEFEATYFDDPAPQGPKGQPFPQLWNYEVLEIFFLASKTQEYLEVEVSPHGQHLILLLRGKHNLLTYKLPLVYQSKINYGTKKWFGVAQIPLSYIPKDVDRMNAYAIHGLGDQRQFESLYPVPTGKYSNPDFHRLGYFRTFDLFKILNANKRGEVGTYFEKFPAKTL